MLSVGDKVWVSNRKGEVVYINETPEHLYGVRKYLIEWNDDGQLFRGYFDGRDLYRSEQEHGNKHTVCMGLINQAFENKPLQNDYVTFDGDNEQILYSFEGIIVKTVDY